MSQRSTDVNPASPMERAVTEESLERSPFQDLHAVPSERRGPQEPGNSPNPAPDAPEPPDEDVSRRLDRLEKQNFRMKLALVVMVMIIGYVTFDQLVSESTIIRQTLMESRELKLIDNDGNPRLFLRMYSRVPVLQLLDSNGKPRMSLGMRFDDTPFLDLSDKRGRTRATLELTEDDSPALQLFDENGEPTFKIN